MTNRVQSDTIGNTARVKLDTPLDPAHPLTGVTATDLDVLARTIYGEARGESIEGQAGVAWVVRHRVKVKRKAWGLTVTAVCRAPKQFSCWNDGDANAGQLHRLTVANPYYLRALWIAAAVLRGDYPDPTGGAQYYLALGSLPKGAPKWWAKMRITVKIDHHTFSREA